MSGKMHTIGDVRIGSEQTLTGLTLKRLQYRRAAREDVERVKHQDSGSLVCVTCVGWYQPSLPSQLYSQLRSRFNNWILVIIANYQHYR